MATAREHLVKRTTTDILLLLLGRHTPEERASILADIANRLAKRRQR
jgi:hypothetical protein